MFLFRGMVRNGIPTVCFYSIFVPWERNSELFSLPRKGSEPNSKSKLLFLFHGTEFRVVFSSVEGFGTEFREVSVPRNSRNSVGNYHLFRLFRLPQNYFFVGNSQPYFHTLPHPAGGGGVCHRKGKTGGGSKDQMISRRSTVSNHSI